VYRWVVEQGFALRGCVAWGTCAHLIAVREPVPSQSSPTVRRWPAGPPSQATRGANRRSATAWQGNSRWAGGQWRRRLAGGGTRRHGRDGDGNKDNGHSGPHMVTIRRVGARAATSALATGSVLKAAHVRIFLHRHA
jgi:hypothetical protein